MLALRLYSNTHTCTDSYDQNHSTVKMHLKFNTKIHIEVNRKTNVKNCTGIYKQIHNYYIKII